MPIRLIWTGSIFFLLLPLLGAQPARDSLRLEQCIDYAIAHRPSLLAAREELRIAELDNRIAVSSWLPSLSVSGNLQHYFQLPVSIFPDFENPGSGETREVEIGTVNSSNLSVAARQTIFNPTVAAAVRRQAPVLEASRLLIEEEEIIVIEQVSTAFYDAVRARERYQLLGIDVLRQERALEDARLLYENGLSDKVDYKRATITLNRTRVELQNAIIEEQSRIAELKQTMGYPASQELNPRYDIDYLALTVMAADLPLLDPSLRVELRRLVTQDRLLELELLFYRRAWLPDLYLGGTYNMTWQSNEITELYDRVFPNALASLNLNIPIFNGGRRFRQIERQSVLRNQLSYEVLDLRDRVESEYRVAVATFDQARNSYALAQENLALAREIYEVVDLQYREGIAPFLSVIIAENDLQTARLDLVNSLLDAALARVSVRRAAGTLLTTAE